IDVTPAKARALEALAKFGFIGDTPDTGGARPTASVPDLYAVLGVPRTATPQEIRQAYHERARRHHPDAAGTSDGAKDFQACHEAYATLKDPKSRAAYDAITRAA